MSAPALFLVPLDARRDVEQLVLRQVAAFVPMMVPEPWAVVVARRRLPRQRCRSAGPLTAPNPYAGDLETYRAPVRRPPRRSAPVRPKRAPGRPVAPVPAARRALLPVRPGSLQVYAPRSLRPGARPRSVGLAPLTEDERYDLERDEAWLRERGLLARPRNEGQADCSNIPDAAPCPFLGCRMHLGKETERWILKLNFPDREVWELPATCTFRVVRDRGALSLEEVGKIVNLTQERVSQIEESGRAKLKRWARGRRRIQTGERSDRPRDDDPAD